MDKKERNLNRVSHLQQVKQLLFNNIAVSRADISRQTGLHKSTVTSLFNELDRKGIVQHLGRGDSTQSGGRKPELFSFNTHYGYVACFNITYDHVYAMFLYIDGQEITFHKLTMNSRETSVLIDTINQELAKQAANDDTENGLLGIGISIHAVVDHNQIIHSPYYQLNSIDLRKYFNKRYQVPVLIGNEANLAAIYERDYAAKQQPDNFIVFSLHRGPGIGVIANKQLFSGYHGMVGELGSVRPLFAQTENQDIGDLLSADFLQENLCEAFAVKNDTDFDTLNQLTKANPALAKPVVEHFAQLSANIFYNLWMMYGPAEIFINAPLVENVEVLGEALEAQSKAVGLGIPISIIKGSKYVSLLGAGAAIIRHVIDLNDVNLNFRWSKDIG